MNPDQSVEPDLVGYLWNCLDEADRRHVADRLQTDPQLRAELANLRARLAPLAWDREPETPPTDLVYRTLAKVSEHACRECRLPEAPPVTRSASSERPWRRRIDVAVAASVVLTSLGLLLPTILAWNQNAVRVTCQDNLRAMWDGLKGYQSNHHRLPDPNGTARPVAGMVAPLLRDAGYLGAQKAMLCPGAPSVKPSVGWSVEKLSELAPEAFADVAPRLLPGYAYSLGFRDARDKLHPVDAMLAEIAAPQLPVLGDAPAIQAGFGNSPNHGGTGQNLLFMDGHVAFQTTRMLGDDRDDIYLNRENRVKAGVGANDIVLGGSSSPP